MVLYKRSLEQTHSLLEQPWNLIVFFAPMFFKNMFETALVESNGSFVNDVFGLLDEAAPRTSRTLPTCPRVEVEETARHKLGWT